MASLARLCGCKIFKCPKFAWISPSSSFPTTNRQKERGDATVIFGQGYVIVLGRSRWWFGEVSNEN
jgi:hypothetical protein